MKQLFKVLMVAAVISSCSGPAADNVRAFIPGIYIKEINDEFSKGMDTLVFEVMDETGGVYSIKRRTGYQQTIDGKQLSPQYETESWTAVYDEKTHQLMEQRKGRVFTFLPDQDKLSMGSSEYRKIK
jgi:hypothetical protein